MNEIPPALRAFVKGAKMVDSSSDDLDTIASLRRQIADTKHDLANEQHKVLTLRTEVSGLRGQLNEATAERGALEAQLHDLRR